MYTFVTGVVRLQESKEIGTKLEEEIRSYLGPTISARIGPRDRSSTVNQDVQLPHTDRECVSYKISKGAVDGEIVVTFYGDLFRYHDHTRITRWFKDLCQHFIPIKHGMMLVELEETHSQIILVWNDSAGVIEKVWS